MVMVVRRPRIGRAAGLGVGAAIVTLLGVTAGLDGLTTTERVSLLGLSALCAGAVAMVEAAARRSEYGRRPLRLRTPQPTVHSSLFHLPRDINDFTGREAEVARTVEFLASPRGQEAVPVAVIAGPGGVGKTSPGKRCRLCGSATPLPAETSEQDRYCEEQGS